jgi:CheY-like chemotaxis protein/methyl-accepting chemotaxis protein
MTRASRRETSRLQLSLRKKLIAIVALIVVSLCAMLLVSLGLGLRQAQEIQDVESRMVPKLELGPRLQSEFEHLRRSMQEAVAAQDPAALDDSIRERNAFIGTVSSAGPALTAADAAELRHAITAYHEAAYGVSRRMLRGEAGESLVDAIAAMQAQQHATEELIQRSAGLDRRELAQGFGAVRASAKAGTRYALVIGLVTLVVVIVVLSRMGSSAVAQLAGISRGVARFATGDFEEPIPVTREDELGKLAVETNLMARALHRSDWLKQSLADLSNELRSELTFDEVAARALEFVCKRVSAVAGVLWVDDGHGNVKPAARVAAEAVSGAVAPSFRAGEGLVGRALTTGEFTVVEPPPGYFKLRSGLGAGEPRTLLLSPLARADRRVGVLELALFEPCKDEAREFLLAAREMIAISLEVARSAAGLRTLLEQTQKQADLLAAQEEELRASNRELSNQQDELQRANDELEAQRQELSAQNLELEQAREDLVQKATELARVSSYKSQFLANMSHELRTPLNSMLLLSHLLAENEGGNLLAKQVEHARTIHAAGQDLLGLINQVLDLAKIEAGRQDVILSEVRLSDLVHYAERLFRTTAEQSGVEFHTELDPRLPPTIVTDRQRVERILVNLLGNALKFTDQGEVRLSIRRPEQTLELASGRLEPKSSVAFVVADTGIGIPAAAQQRIFAPFEQAETRSDRRFGGTGLGLAIARESALLLGGELLLESREGHGSTFTCYLPEHAPETAKLTGTGRMPEIAAPPRAPVEDDRRQLTNGSSYLLVIEDDATFAEQLVTLIHRQHFKAVVATSGEEGLRLAKEKKPYGVILDVKLPDLDGWTVMERLKREPATRSVPVHFISGVDAPERAFSLGAVGFLTKPATPTELLGAIRLLTQGVDGTPSTVLIVEDDASEGDSVVELLRTAGYAARRVGSAQAALDALANERFGCVILDLGLPDMDGLGLLESLRDEPATPMPPVIVHTGRSLTRDEIRRLQAYAEAVVIKGGTSGERLLEEVRLFVQHLRGDTAKQPLAPERSALPDVSLAGVEVLLADDDMRTVYALAALLRGKGADVHVAETGREALDVLSTHPNVQAVLMDVMMPELDGYEALRRLRADARFKSIPAIALTAKAMNDERERCLAAGANEYLAKPVDPGRLLTTLDGLLKANGHGRPG